MKMWSMNVMILLLFCYACLSTGKGKVYFVSKNFFNVLHWDPVNPNFPGQEMLYSVRLQRHGEKQYEIKACQNITALLCDLTANTTSVHDVHYVAQVSVNGISLGSTTRFRPLANTIFGSPNLSISPTVSALHVNVTLPLGPNGVSIANITEKSKNVHCAFQYALKITDPKWAAQESKNTSGQFVINLKNSQTQYCGYVYYKATCEQGRKGSENTSFCATLPAPDSSQMHLHWILVGAGVLAVIIILSVVCTCIYVKGGKPKSEPGSLGPVTSGTRNIQQVLDRNCIISEAEVCSSNEKTVYATIRMKPNGTSAGSEGYSPQDIPYHASQGSAVSSVGTGVPRIAPNPVNMSAQSSEIYSAVAVHVPEEEDEDFQHATSDNGETSHSQLSSNGASWDNGRMSPKLTSRGSPALPLLGEAKQLVLHTVRDTNGQLMLSSLTFPLQSTIGDTASPMSPERKPLLSDLIDSNDGPSFASLQRLDSSEWSDSGCDESTLNTPTHPYCNTHYSPSQPVSSYLHQEPQSTLSSDATFEPGYKPNWMPAILHESASTDSCEYRTNYPLTWTGVNMKEEGEKDENRAGVEGSRQHFLGSWTLQIQE